MLDVHPVAIALVALVGCSERTTDARLRPDPEATDARVVVDAVTRDAPVVTTPEPADAAPLTYDKVFFATHNVNVHHCPPPLFDVRDSFADSLDQAHNPVCGGGTSYLCIFDEYWKCYDSSTTPPRPMRPPRCAPGESDCQWFHATFGEHGNTP